MRDVTVGFRERKEFEGSSFAMLLELEELCALRPGLVDRRVRDIGSIFQSTNQGVKPYPLSYYPTTDNYVHGNLLECYVRCIATTIWSTG